MAHTFSRAKKDCGVGLAEARGDKRGNIITNLSNNERVYSISITVNTVYHVDIL